MSADDLLLSGPEQHAAEWLRDHFRERGAQVDFGKFLYQLKAAGATDWQQSAEDFVRHGLLELDYSYWLRIGLVEAGKETPWPAFGGFNYEQVEQKMRLYELRQYPECRIMRRLLDFTDGDGGSAESKENELRTSRDDNETLEGDQPPSELTVKLASKPQLHALFLYLWVRRKATLKRPSQAGLER